MSTKIWIGDKMYLVDEPVREYVDELQAELDNLRWIPVEERLPKKDGNIVLYKKSKPMVMHYFTNRTSEQWLMGFTHWKPEILPEGECKQNVFMTRKERIAAFHKARGEKRSEEREQWIPEGE